MRANPGPCSSSLCLSNVVYSLYKILLGGLMLSFDDILEGVSLLPLSECEALLSAFAPDLYAVLRTDASTPDDHLSLARDLVKRAMRRDLN